MSKPKHHVRESVCATRAPYREGRKAKAVKVYTVQQESKYLIVQGIPAVGATDQLISLFAGHGTVAEHRMLDDYPAEQFTDVCLIKFQRIQAARQAKRHLDDWSFYGGVLHVCYAPEYESVQDTREKLQDRRKAVATKIRQHRLDGTYKTEQEETSSEIKQSINQTSHHAGLESGTQSVSHQHHGPEHYPSEENQSTSYDHMTTNQSSDWLNSASYSSNRSNDNRLVIQSTKLPNDNRQAIPSSSTFEEESEQLCLPPPPKQMKFSKPSERRTQKLGRGPSAQAMFPPGFDARTDQPKSVVNDQPNSAVEPSGVSLNEYLSRKGPNALTEKITNDTKTKTVQEKINDNLKTSNLVVKQPPKKISTPRFVPRQTQARFKPKSSATSTELIKSSPDQAAKNDDLKKNAFTLGQSQGPVDLEAHTRVKPGPAEVSLQKSVKQIREKLSQVTQTSNSSQDKERG